MIKNQLIQGTCTDYTYNGLGLLKHEGFCIFVKDMALGDEAEVIITQVRKDYGYGKIMKLIKPSPLRTTPRCPLSRICGGCQIQHLSAEGQASFKQQHVENLMKSIAGLDLPVKPIITMSDPYGYRNKIMMPVGTDKQGNLRLGFYRYNSHDIIDVGDCCLQSRLANEIVSKLKQLIIQYKLESKIRHIMIRDMQKSEEVMVVLVSWQSRLNGLKQLAEELMEAFPAIKSVIQSVNPDDTNVVLGHQEILLAGRDYIYDDLCGLRFKISAHSFYQVNTFQTEVLYRTAAEMAQLKADDEVLDLYCGVGTIGLSLSRQVKKVTGIEIVPQAIEDARINASINDINNAEFICGDAGRQCERLLEEGRHFDCVIVDPPRKGCSRETIELLKKLASQRIIYISCNPSTLARDLALLKDDYEIRKIQPVDMFPHTYHLECITLLERQVNFSHR